MQETIKLLGAIDMQIKRQSTHGTPKNSNNNSINLSSHGSSVRKQKFPYARILDFGAEKYTSYPKWLT
jgi:hypothetical protein